MNSSKRFQLTVLVVVAIALFAGAPAFAETYGPFTLTNVTAVGDPDHLATGQATLIYFGSPWAGLTVTCQGLTPGQLYRIGPLPSRDRNFRIVYSYVTFTASADGSGMARAYVATFMSNEYGGFQVPIKVDRVVSSQGKGQYVKVFSGRAFVGR